jgi:predicted cupin superfamily sugar epimerase
VATPPARFWIDQLGLQPHPEGGWYRETYRSSRVFTPPADAPGAGPRAVATAIYYLLSQGDRSRLHVLQSDELWFYQAGEALTVHGFPPAGPASTFTLGTRADQGQVLQGLVPAGTVFGALHAEGTPAEAYSLVACVVAPGFDFRDFAYADAASLRARFPADAALIDRLA